MKSIIETLIREETGLGPLTQWHLDYIMVVVGGFFRAKRSVVVLYNENQKNYLYFFPTNELNEEEPRKSEPISEEQFEKYKEMTDIMIKDVLKTKDFRELKSYFKIKIVRKLPDKVVNSESIKNADQTR